MRYATTPAWVYVMLIVMGIGFIAGAVPFWLFVPVSGHLVALIWVVMGAGFVVFSARALGGRRDDARIRRQGTAATATLLSASTTGWVVNGVPQWALRLRIEGAGAPYETTLKLQTYNPPGNGARLGVRVDPLRRNHVVLSDDAPAPAAGGADTFTAAAGASPRIEAAVAAALRQAGFGEPGTTATVNPDGSRTITTTTFSVDGASPDAAPDAAETVRLLGELDRLRASGTLGDAEFDALKRKLLGEA